MWSNSWNECNQLRIRDLHVIIFFPSVAIKKKKFCWPPARQKRDFLFCWRLPIKIQIQKFSSSLLSKSTIYILTGLTVKSKIHKFVSRFLSKSAIWIFSGRLLLLKSKFLIFPAAFSTKRLSEYFLRPKTKIRKFASHLPGKRAIWIFLDSHLKSKFKNMPDEFLILHST